MKQILKLIGKIALQTFGTPIQSKGKKVFDNQPDLFVKNTFQKKVKTKFFNLSTKGAEDWTFPPAFFEIGPTKNYILQRDAKSTSFFVEYSIPMIV